MINFKPYESKYIQDVKDIITDDNYELDRILWFIEQYPQCTTIAKDYKNVVAVSVFSGKDKSTDLLLYVKPEYRRRGLGSKLLKITEEKMKESGVKSVECCHVNGIAEKAFMKNLEYDLEFSSSLMTYSLGKMPEPKYKVIPYDDKYYTECHNVIRGAFHKMQVAVGIEEETYECPPNEWERNEYLTNAENMFLMQVGEEIVAALILDDEEVDIVAVEVSQQGKGYGKEIMAFAINKIIDDGYNEVELWCIVGNSAEKFYNKLGFVKQRTHDIVSRKL